MDKNTSTKWHFCSSRFNSLGMYIPEFLLESLLSSMDNSKVRSLAKSEAKGANALGSFTAQKKKGQTHKASLGPKKRKRKMWKTLLKKEWLWGKTSSYTKILRICCIICHFKNEFWAPQYAVIISDTPPLKKGHEFWSNPGKRSKL